MGRPTFEVAAVFHLPKSHGAVFTGRCQCIRVGTPAHVGNHGRVVAQAVELAGRGRFPHEQAAVAVAGGQQHAVRAEFEGRHPVRVLLDLVGHDAIGSVVDADEFRWAAYGNQLLIRTDVGTQKRIGLDAHFRDLFAGLDVVQHGLATRTAPATCCQQQLAVPAELQRVDLAMFKRQTAEVVAVVGVVQQHLFLPTHSHDGCPRAGRHRQHRAGSLGLEKQIELEFPDLRHRRWSFGLALADVGQTDVHLRFLRHHDLGPGVLAGTLVDPELHDSNLCIGNLRAGRWHLRFFGVRRECIQPALGRITRLQHIAPGPALFDGGQCGHVQPALLFVVPVAARTVLLEDG